VIKTKAEKLIVVNEKDRITGYEDRKKCHRDKGILHRAFTIFVFNKKNQILIQKRSKNKLLWPLFWETSCSSHPRRGEICLKAAKKRLKEELGFTCQLKSLSKFRYRAVYKNINSENEICVILTGKYDGKIKPNPKEVADWKWIDIKKLKRNITKNPDKYAPWLKISLECL